MIKSWTLKLNYGYKFVTMRRGFSFLNVKSILFFAAVLFATLPNEVFSQEVNVLIIGSSHSYSEGKEHGAIHEKAFNPVGIGNELQNIPTRTMFPFLETRMWL